MPSPPSVDRQVLTGHAALTTVRGTSPGPTVALLGGVHGDEDEGVLAVHQVVRQVQDLPFAGTLRAVAPAHPAAWAARSRFSPLDGGNLARSFPGTDDDGPTAAIAAAITEHVIDGSSALVDLHSAGLRYRMPLMCGYCEDTAAPDDSRRLADAFNAPVIWRHPKSAPGRSLSAAGQLGVPAIYAECSGGGSIRAAELDAFVDGTLSVLAELDMLPPAHRRSGGTRRWVSGDGDLDAGAEAQHDGLFVSSVRAGDALARGAEIGRLYSYDGALVRTIHAPDAGMVMFLRRQARTARDDVLFTMAHLDREAER